MNSYKFEGKNYDDVLKNALQELGVSEDQVTVNTEEIKGSLFKSAQTILTIVKIEDISEYIKEYLKKLLTEMGIDAKFESRIREKQINIKMYSDKNAILIGKNGQTLEALQNIVKSVVHKEIGYFPTLLLDVENYKEKQEKNLERLAKNVAKDVVRTKVEVKLENMNSYERRIVHNILSDFRGVTTISEGEEPNRRVIIKPKDE